VLTGGKGAISQLNVFMANLDTASLNNSLANLRLAFRDLDDTLRKLQRNPAGFLLGKAPPPVRGVEKARE
jgi:hypothetical protein